MTRSERLTFGDFQTPDDLAASIVQRISEGFEPRSLLEPTCGKGALLLAALAAIPALEQITGIDIHPAHLKLLAQKTQNDPRVTLRKGNAFTINWRRAIQALPAPVLILGNPPWVTSSRLGTLSAINGPKRSTKAVSSGLEAVTGKSNFDVSEWLLICWLKAMEGVDARLVMLVKSSVARRLLLHISRHQPDYGARITPVDAVKQFGASVSACVLEIYKGGPKVTTHGNRIVAKPDLYAKWQHLAATDALEWRSGIKHDAAKVFELSVQADGTLVNGFGSSIDIEQQYLFPLLKSADLSLAGTPVPTKVLIVPQFRTSAPTEAIQGNAPQTWNYLESHRNVLNARASGIYRNTPPFAIFGIGAYSFAPWKVATSCLHKQLRFHVVGPHNGKPVVFDDTCAFIGFETRQEADRAAALLASEPAREFLDSLIFWDGKRPVTIEVLRALSLDAIAAELKQVR